MARLLPRLLCILALLSVAGTARAATLERDILLDATRALTFEQVRDGDPGFKTMAAGEENIGLTDAAIWLRLRPGPLDPMYDWLLTLNHPVIDQIDAYVVSQAGTVVQHRIGDLRPYAERPYPHHAFVVPVPPDTAVVFMRVLSQGSAVLPIELLPRDELQDRDRGQFAIYGFYFGILIAMAAYNACIFVVVRDRAYIFYVIYVLSFGALQAQINGFAAPLTPVAGLDANKLLLLLYATVIASGLRFVQVLIDTDTLMPRWHKLLTAIGAVSLLAGLGGLVLPYGPIIRLLIALGGIVLIVILIVVPIAIARGSQTARYLALAFLSLLPGCALFVMRALGMIPHSLLTQHSLELSTALETIVLSFALANRINVWRAEAAAAELQAAQAHTRYSRQLARAMEDDRRRIAAELHDSVGQSLLVLSNGLKRVVGGKAEPRRLADMAELARQSVDDVRTVAQDLHPAQLERLGLADALSAMLRRTFADSGVELHLEIDADALPAEPMRDVQLYRIAQEASSNVLRHAGARNCWVRLTAVGGRVALSVEDDGGGIRDGASDGLGLSTQAERAALIGADYALGTRAGGGTRLSVDAPREPAS
ncbi:MAG: 7TM diverse intracellular signaling domain-containing protein [Alphaproteobacteria bacterium]